MTSVIGPRHSFFNEGELTLLDNARRDVDAASATIAYCAYENPFARGGGLYAVAMNYTAELKAQGREVIALSPLHSRLRTAPRAALKSLGTCEVPFGGAPVKVSVFEHLQGAVRWILFGADGYFGAIGGDPYVHNDPEGLLTDSLFACTAIPCVMSYLAIMSNVIIHVQDWELAATALTAKLAILDGRLHSAAIVLTSHNPYDHGLPRDKLLLLTSRAPQGDRPTDTVYQSFLPLCDAPLTTVSKTFAEELTTDPLQTEYFAEHLQSIYADCGLMGVDNGLFLPPREPFSSNAVAAAAACRPDAIIAEKNLLRRRMLIELDEYNNPGIQGRLAGHDGAPLRELPDSIPVFLMFGRMDPGQKGFDVLARAIEAMPRRRCRFVLTPIVSKTTSFSEDLRQLAAQRAGDVVVYPMRMERGYMETMAGATFAVLPSLYEPFGAATEPYLMGTPVIGRATGGLCQQIVDAYADVEHATGFLYRETAPDVSTIAHDWRVIQRSDVPLERFATPLYGAMVASLAASLASAAESYRCDKVAYGKMLANLQAKALSFGWSRSYAEYQRVYELATK